jgi:hypothetical protein
MPPIQEYIPENYTRLKNGRVRYIDLHPNDEEPAPWDTLSPPTRPDKPPP